MTTNLKAVYENGVLRLKEALPIPEGAQVEVTVTLEEEVISDRSTGMEDPSWEDLNRLLADCAIDTGITDLSQQHDHYLYGLPKK